MRRGRWLWQKLIAALSYSFAKDENNSFPTILYDKHDAVGFYFAKFCLKPINIPCLPSYGVYASQLIRYACCCSNYGDFLSHYSALVMKLSSQGYKVNNLSTTFKKFYTDSDSVVGQDKINVCQTLLILSA